MIAINERTRPPSASETRDARSILARGARRLADIVPLRPLGFLLGIAAGAVIAWVAYPAQDYVLLIGSGAVLVWIAATTLLVVLSSVAVAIVARKSTSSEPQKLETARSLPTGFSLPSLWFVPFVEVRWTWIEPDARLELRTSGGRHVESAALALRGHYSAVVRRIEVSDVFGLARIALRIRESRAIDVLPHAGALRQLPLLVSMAGGEDVPHAMGIAEGDRVDLRRYAPGDSARFIHWKIFGRTKKLVVRMPERALTRARRTVSYLVAGPSDEASAACARVAIEERALGSEWIFGADGTPSAQDNVADAVQAVVRSRSFANEGALALDRFVRIAEEQGPASWVIFAPPIPGPWLGRVAHVVRSRASRTRVVIGVDGLSRSQPRNALERLLWVAPAPTGASLFELENVLDALRPLRCEVVVIDRRSGKVIADAHVRGVRKRKAA